MLSKFPDQCKYKGKATVTQHNSPLHIIPDLGGKRIGSFHERDATGNILDFPMVAQNPEVRAAAKYQPGYDGLPESGKKLPPCMAECANGCAIRSGDAS